MPGTKVESLGRDEEDIHVPCRSIALARGHEAAAQDLFTKKDLQSPA